MNFVVTGASKGIGYQTVVRLAENSGHTIIAIARDEEKLNRLAHECNKQRGTERVISVPFDLSDTEKIGTALIETIREKLGSLDVLINNAGYLTSKTFRNMAYSDLMAHFRVNYFSVFELTKYTLDLFKASSTKHIVNIGTMGAIQGSMKFKGMSAYISSKAALANLTEALAEELKEEGIRVNYLAIGAVDTQMFREAFPGAQAPTTPGEIANFIAYFAQDGWRYFNGKILPVSSSVP